MLRDTTSFRAFLPVGDISLDNYAGVFERVPAALFIFNSLLITCTTVALGIDREQPRRATPARGCSWRGRELVLTIIIATLIVPFETIAIPLLLVVTTLPWIGFQDGALTVEQGWLNTYQVQILPFAANAFSIFLFAQFFKSLPIDLDEAARVDGATEFQVYRKVIMPLSGPVVATVAILTFLPIWNAYLWPLMVVQSEGVRPVMVGLQYFFKVAGGGGGGGGVAWGEIMAYLSMVTLPDADPLPGCSSAHFVEIHRLVRREGMRVPTRRSGPAIGLSAQEIVRTAPSAKRRRVASSTAACPSVAPLTVTIGATRDVAEAEAAIDAAISIGITMFDHADVYRMRQGRGRLRADPRSRPGLRERAHDPEQVRRAAR